jgi:NADH-quinone oxidoreductase subunit K
MTVPIEYFLGASVVLFCIGLYGILTKKNAIIILMCIEFMLNAANINFVAFSAYYGDSGGFVFALFSITIAAAEVAVGLAILLVIYRRFRTIDTTKVDLLKG